jgi:hypothetical protein
MAVEHLDSVAPGSRALAERIGERTWAEDLYLAGSAALALYVGHRPVKSLDLMTAHNRLTGAERRDLLAELLEIDPGVKVETARDGYLYARCGESFDGAVLKLFYYPYPLVDPTLWLGELAVVSPTDLGLMKLGAIISRGTKRDFVDLYLLCRHLPLADLLERSVDKYGHVRDFPVQALKSLTDRTLTVGEPVPRMATAVQWPAVEAWLDEEATRLGAALLTEPASGSHTEPDGGRSPQS